MLNFKPIALNLIVMLLLLTGCKKTEDKKNDTEPINNSSQVPSEPLIIGNYVTDGYEKRDEGYDWVSVSIKNDSENKLSLFIRSRIDKKKPTCTFDATLLKVNDSTYNTFVEGTEVLVAIKNNILTIKTKIPEENGVLAFYCSGGANISGNYTKIEGLLDQAQIDKTAFSKVLRLQGIGFNISSIKTNESNTVTIQPFGLELVNNPETVDIEGQVVNSEIEDLNSDGFPEILVFTTSDGSGSYGNVVGYSVNNGKSMSQIYFPPTAENKQINKGYMGHDEFAIVETSLVQRFPIYNENDTNANPSGGTRQVQYKLQDGEAMRKFEVQSITEY
jgi:hypothetical protein